MARIVSTFEVEDCNRALAQAGLPTRVHLHDACGGQFFSWDSLGERDADVREAAEHFFSSKGIKLEFVGDSSFRTR